MTNERHLRDLLRESYEERDIIVEFLEGRIKELEERNEYLHAKLEEEQTLFSRVCKRLTNK